MEWVDPAIDLAGLSGYWIQTSWVERVAFEDAQEGEPQSPESAVFFESLDAVG